MLRNSSLTRFFACWRGMAEARAEQLRKLRVAAARMCNRLLALCFGACLALVAAKRRREEAARLSLVRMLNKMLVMTWEAWRAQVEARRVAMAGCAAMCARALGREHLAALLFWRDCAQRSIRGEQIRALLGDKVRAISLYLPFISPTSRLSPLHLGDKVRPPNPMGYLPISPYTSLYLPVSPHISRYLASRSRRSSWAPCRACSAGGRASTGTSA